MSRGRGAGPAGKAMLRHLTPPILWRGAAWLRRRVSGPTRGRGSGESEAKSAAEGDQTWEYGVEQPPEFYDWAFEGNAHWRLHYSESPYYPLWTVVADRVRRAGAERVLDVGCGPGQVASLLRDKGIANYIGLDFSPARVRRARAVCPDYRFQVADIFASTILDDEDYDCVLLLEFLEHIERDREVLGRIRPGTRVIATVPNFPSAGHVRHFEDPASVEARYAACLMSIEVETHRADARGKTYFLVEGVAGPAG